MTPPNPDKGTEKLDHSCIAGRNVKVVEPLRKQAITYETKLQLPYDPAITILDIYPGEIKNYFHTK